MLTKNGTDDKKTQIQLISLDQLVPEDHLLRKIDKYIDFDFIYDLSFAARAKLIKTAIFQMQQSYHASASKGRRIDPHNSFADFQIVSSHPTSHPAAACNSP